MRNYIFDFDQQVMIDLDLSLQEALLLDYLTKFFDSGYAATKYIDRRKYCWITYKKILGANLNILNMKRKAGSTTKYEPPRKLKPHQRGGNRVLRGSRTNTVMHYGPHDRAWILRIVNSGTTERTAGTRGGRLSGNRGAIAARNFFGSAATNALSRAADNLANLIDTELMAMLNKTK